MAGNTRWNTQKCASQPARAGAGKLSAASSASRGQTPSPKAATNGRGPDVLGFDVAALEELADLTTHGSTRYRCALASPRISLLLALESRGRGRPKIDPELRRLIRQMCCANPLWGAPWIHGELLKLGIDVSEATVSRYMIRRRGPPSQHWRSFLDNHARELISIDFFTVPLATFRILFVLVILDHERRRILHFNVTAHPTAVWTARQHRWVYL